LTITDLQVNHLQVKEKLSWLANW